MYMLILPALLLQLKDQFGVSITQITSLGTICYFLYGIMALPGGFLADKWSYKAVLTMFFIGTPAAACIVGSARSALGLGIGLALLGVFASLYHPSGLALVSHSVKERGKALGLHGMAGNLGLAFSPIIAGGLALRFSWRHSYYFLSLPGFIAGIVFILTSRLVLKAEQPDTASLADPAQTIPDQSKQRFTLWAIILLYAAMALTGFCYRGTVTMLPTYLGRSSIGLEFQSDLDNETVSEGLLQGFQNSKTELSQSAIISIKEPGSRWEIKDGHKGRKYDVMKEKDRLNIYGRGTAGRLLFATMVYLVGMLGQYMGGYSSDRRRKTRLYLLFNAVSLPFMILVGLTAGMMVVAVAALFALFHFAIQPVENGLIAQYTPARLRSSSYGLKFFFTFGFGSLGATFSGYIADLFGFSSVFLALGGVIFLMVLVILSLNVAAREARVETPQ
jgi:MFS family permease